VNTVPEACLTRKKYSGVAGGVPALSQTGQLLNKKCQLNFRGEKLIVTKDNRPGQRNNNSLRKCLCWSIGLIFVAAAITIGSLIGGTVVIFLSSRSLNSGKERGLLPTETGDINAFLENLSIILFSLPMDKLS
jgi:hypothetical protein